MLDDGSSHTAPLTQPADLRAIQTVPLRAGAAPRLRVGLLNNMPDAAFIKTERQFRRLIGPDVALDLFAFRDSPRDIAVEADIAARYAPHEALAGAGLDALVVTGCEPKQARLEDEPFFASLSAVVDWAAQNTVSTLFSCLASHAAVLHLDRIRRRPLPIKHSGVFACETRAAHPLLAKMPQSVAVPHSRWNDLPEAELVAHGYTVLRCSSEVGVDLFVRDASSLFVFLQGHPEYDADGLAREYRRDMGRFLAGTAASCPELPKHYYRARGEAVLEAFATEAKAVRNGVAFSAFPGLDAAPLRPAAWQAAAAQLFQNWLACIASRKADAIRAVA